MTLLTIALICFLGLLAVDQFFAWGDNRRRSEAPCDPITPRTPTRLTLISDALSEAGEGASGASFDWPQREPVVVPIHHRRSQAHPYLVAVPSTDEVA